MSFLDMEDNHPPVSVGTVFGAMFPSSDWEVFFFLSSFSVRTINAVRAKGFSAR